MIIPFLYTFKHKKESVLDILIIIIIMTIIVILYWPLTTSIYSLANIFSKFLLFLFFPLLIIFLTFRIRINNGKQNDYNLSQFGISSKGIRKSSKLGLYFIPFMIGVTFFVKFTMNISYNPDFILGLVSFFESFTEEFFFRGILFLYLISRTDLKIAYITSLTSFILLHPQNFSNPFIISTIVQGFFTLEICRRSGNLAGAWILHGTNRFFSIVIYPLILYY